MHTKWWAIGQYGIVMEIVSVQCAFPNLLLVLLAAVQQLDKQFTSQKDSFRLITERL